MEDKNGRNDLWALMNIIGPAILLGLLIWLVMRSRADQSTTDTTAQTEAGTRAEYAEEEAPPPRRDRRPLIAGELPDVVQRWFDERGWQPRRHQLEMLALAQARAKRACWSPRPAPARRSPGSCRPSAS